MIDESALALILHHVGLVNRLNRTQSHRDCRELPVIGHQPGMGVRGKTLTSDLAPKVLQLRLADHTLEVGACIHTRGTMALVINQVAGVPVCGATKEMIHTHVI